ncbi:MAG: AEC family transporter [Ruminococcaceae bacterium]|nr:AEC family transporter [Oscillospiraceae bacterium]
MLENLMTVSTQVLILFAMIAIGFVLSKTKLVNEQSVGGMTNTLLWAVTPCLIIETFSRSFDPELAMALGVFSLSAFLGMVLAAIMGLLIFRKPFGKDSPIMTFASTFSNCGFMGVPLAEALFGAEGVMFASTYVVVFNASQWTYGCMILSGRKGISLRRLLLNPGILGLAAGLPLFIFSIQLPDTVSKIISSVADINTPLAMIVIGCHLAETNLLKALTDKRVYAVVGLRLLLVPAVCVLLVWLLPIPLSALACTVLCIELSAPSAATSVLIGTLCGHDGELPSRCVAVTTLFSIITLPVVAAVCQYVM